VITVFVYARVRLYREGLAEILAHERVFDVLGTAAKLGEALAKLATLEPDVLVVDTSFRESRAEIRTIAAKTPAAAVVAVAIPDSEESVIAFAEVGATGYVTRDASGEELVKAVRHAARGEVVCPPRFVATVFRRLALLAMQQEPEPPVERLTTREREVVFLIGEGLSNKQIAERLLIEVATVKQHVHNILEKLEVAHRSEAAAAVRTAALT
jgi:two-component system, NarL family, nitrate/nitrite response regulator NarL